MAEKKEMLAPSRTIPKMSSNINTPKNEPNEPYPLLFLDIDPRIPPNIDHPPDRPPNLPRIINVARFYKDKTDTTILTLPDAIVTLLYNWHPHAAHQVLEIKYVPTYYFKLRAPEGKCICALVVNRDGKRITVGYEDKFGKLRGDQITGEVQEDGAWKFLSVRYPSRNLVSVVPEKVEKAAREMAVEIMGMREWEAAGKFHMQSRPSP